MSKIRLIPVLIATAGIAVTLATTAGAAATSGTGSLAGNADGGSVSPQSAVVGAGSVYPFSPDLANIICLMGGTQSGQYNGTTCVDIGIGL